MKLVIKAICHVVNFLLFLLAVWIGLHDNDYAQASFLMTLVIINELNLRN